MSTFGLDNGRPPENNSRPVAIAPAYCNAASTTLQSWAKLSVADIHTLHAEKGSSEQEIYHYIPRTCTLSRQSGQEEYAHPIKWIRVVGVIVAREDYGRRWVFTLDDSSGELIECVVTRPGPVSEGNEGGAPSETVRSATGLDVSDVVKVRGVLGLFRGVRQLHVRRMNRVMSTLEEAGAWMEMVHFRNEVVESPWHLEREEMDRLRKEEEMIAKKSRPRRRGGRGRKKRGRHSAEKESI